MVGVNDPIGVIDFRDSVQGPNLGFYWNPLFDVEGRGGPSFEIFLELEVTDYFFRLPQPESSGDPQPDVLTAGPLFHHVLYGLDHFGVRLAVHDLEPVLGREDIYRVLWPDHTHVYFFQRFFCRFPDNRDIAALDIDLPGDVRKQFPQFKADNPGKLGGTPTGVRSVNRFSHSRWGGFFQHGIPLFQAEQLSDLPEDFLVFLEKMPGIFFDHLFGNIPQRLSRIVPAVAWRGSDLHAVGLEQPQ